MKGRPGNTLYSYADGFGDIVDPRRRLLGIFQDGIYYPQRRGTVVVGSVATPRSGENHRPPRLDEYLLMKRGWLFTQWGISPVPIRRIIEDVEPPRGLMLTGGRGRHRR